MGHSIARLSIKIAKPQRIKTQISKNKQFYANKRLAPQKHWASHSIFDVFPTPTKTLRALQEPKATLGLVQFIAFLRSKVKPIRPKLHKRSAVKDNRQIVGANISFFVVKEPDTCESHAFTVPPTIWFPLNSSAFHRNFTEVSKMQGT